MQAFCTGKQGRTPKSSQQGRFCTLIVGSSNCFLRVEQKAWVGSGNVTWKTNENTVPPPLILGKTVDPMKHSDCARHCGRIPRLRLAWATQAGMYGYNARTGSDGLWSRPSHRPIKFSLVWVVCGGLWVREICSPLFLFFNITSTCVRTGCAGFDKELPPEYFHVAVTGVQVFYAAW